MKKLALFVLFLSTISCATVPITGRRQLDLVSDSSMQKTSYTEYRKFLNSKKLSTNKTQVDMVKRVGQKVKRSVEKYLREKKQSHLLKGYRWEFNLVESKEVNAWCMPGGKVVVYTGILPYTKNEEGLAVVMGHEVAHAIAKHGNERMSHQMVTQLGGMALSTALKKQNKKTKSIWMGAIGAGTNLGILLPYSRLHETEADSLGLIFMAKAGYNPNAAIGFWQRMSKSGGSVPEILSTHPSSSSRIKNIRKKIPEAMKHYRKN